MELNQHLQQQMHSLGFTDTRQVVVLPSLDGRFQHYKVSEKIPSAMGWRQDNLIWAFAATNIPEAKPSLEFITLTMERDIPKEIGVKVTIARSWRNTAGEQELSIFPNKAEMLQELLAGESLAIDRYNQMSVARQVNNNLTAPAKNKSNHL